MECAVFRLQPAVFDGLIHQPPNDVETFLLKGLFEIPEGPRAQRFDRVLGSAVTGDDDAGEVRFNLMDLAHQMRFRRLVRRALWLPRLENEEADALTNFDFGHFSPGNQIKVELADLNFAVLDDLFKAVNEYVTRLEEEKAKHKPVKTYGGMAPPGTLSLISL